MGETSAIAWTDATFNPWSLGPVTTRVFGLVAWRAERDSVLKNEPEFGMRREAFDVVGVKVATSRVAALPTREAVAREDVVTPSLVLDGKALVATLGEPAVLERVARFPARRPLARALADLLSRLHRVTFAEPVARSSARGLAHLPTSLLGHRRPLRDHQGEV